MKEENFIKLNAHTWNELERMCRQLNQKKNVRLSSSELKHFLHLFRQGSHHLAYAKTHYPESNLVPYLNSLLGKCNKHIYAAPKISINSVVQYIVKGYPKIVQNHKNYILLSFGVFFFGFLLSMILTFIDINYASLFMDKLFVEHIIEDGITVNQWDYAMASSYIMTNNIRVALCAFILGITLGIGTLYILFANGTLLGALTAVVYLYADPTYYWSLILPHGVIELTAIFIAGGAGLIIARSLLIPGDLSRKHSLIHGSSRALSLMGGVVLFLIVAAIIEGFYTPLPVSEVQKLVFAALTGVILTAYFASSYILKES